MSSESVYRQIVALYKELGSVNAVVEKLGGAASKIKVQRVLITEGLWSSKTSREIGVLFEQGKTASEIAEELQLSLKSVQSYLPYTKGAYFENETSDSRLSREYRQRNRNTAQVQVRHVVPVNVEEKVSRMFSPPQKMLRLHLELVCDLDRREKEILRRYGKVKNSISRDVVVPPDITLHALHYAIQRAFGWQNSHLHHFSVDHAFECENVAAVTGDRLGNWGRLCGRYFRFPIDFTDEQEMDDVYWDEDYDEGMSYKIWLRKKYTGPYTYGGIGEHYLAAQTKYRYLVESNPMVRVSPSFRNYLENKGKQSADRIKPIETLTIEEANRFFESGVCELQERLRLDEVLSTESVVPDLVIVPDVEEKDVTCYAAMMSKYRALEEKANRYRAIMTGGRRRLLKADRELLQGPDPEAQLRAQRMEMIRLLNDTDGVMQPITDTLYYVYDYGDNWQVAITCTDVYTLKDGWTQSEEAGDGFLHGPLMDKQFFDSFCVTDRQGRIIMGKMREQIVKASMKHTVKCLAVDGVNLVDDVGGIHSFCEFLEELNGPDIDEQIQNLEWATGMGWSDKKPIAETLL